ncbi:MAG TPA: hypothetical protein VM736_00660 [Gemmatimonadales bacterium]|nr:hypothetical protein [Gemmatimonadales bacterium]
MLPPPPPPSGSGAPATLARELADFLIELSIALHKHAMYPEGHPSLHPAATALTHRAALLLDSRPALALGVARRQLVIEGVATDPKHPVLAELAGRLHRHHLGAVTFRRGVDPAEVAAALATLAADPERGGSPLGLGDPARLRAWTHIELHPLTYERLELAADGTTASEAGARAAQLWVGLARAALARTADDQQVPLQEPAVIARAIEERAKGDAAAYDQVIVGYLLQIAAELKTAGSAEAAALRRRTAHLIRALTPETLARLVEMGGDIAQRRQFVADVVDGMALEAVLDIVRAAADASHQTISHSLVRLLSKLAVHAESGAAEGRPQAAAALREQVHRLLAGWSLPDPTPTAYGTALARMARTAPADLPSDPGASAGGPAPEPDRLVAMALELGSAGPRLNEAVDRVGEAGRLGTLLDALDRAPESTARTAVTGRVASLDTLHRVVAREPVDFPLLERLVAWLGSAAAPPLLDALATAEGRGTRRGLLAQLAKMGPAIVPLVLARLDDPRWYVTRNLLALLDELRPLPQELSVAPLLHHADARVRWQAVKLEVKRPGGQDDALAAGLHDPDPRTLRLALGLAVALQRCPDAVVDRLAQRAGDRTLPDDVRVLAIRVLGYSSARAARDALLELTSGGRTLFGREKLPPKTPELVAALGALAAGWTHDPRARARLARAARSPDPELRNAAVPTDDDA